MTGNTADRLQAHHVAVRRRRSWLLPPTSLEVVAGAVTLAVGDPDERHTLLALAIAGRLSGFEGEVWLNGRPDQRRLQREVVLVDVAGVTSPEPVLPLRAVVGEELAMAGRKAWAHDVDAWLAENQPADGPTGRTAVGGKDLIGDIEPGIRVRLLTELALMRDPRFLVFALPERHGALPGGWWSVAQEAASRGQGVLVTASPTAAAHIVAEAAQVADIGDASAAAIGSQADDRTEDATEEQGNQTNVKGASS